MSHAEPSKSALGTTILVSEDTPEMQRLTKRMLEKLGYEAMTANNGQEAVEVVQALQIDFILMDIQMPIMDGIEATRVLREQGFDEPIVALSANPQAQADFIEAGGDEFLSKPVNTATLSRVLHRILDAR